ncbi:MAG: hypothetical protein ACFFDI_21280 [Promethearchaeota archaeon]
MRLSKETIDDIKNTHTAEEGGKLQAFFVKPADGLNKERLLKSLSLILSEKDVTDYFKSRGHLFHPADKDFKIKKKAIL